jgi:hypothetical protein
MVHHPMPGATGLSTHQLRGLRSAADALEIAGSRKVERGQLEVRPRCRHRSRHQPLVELMHRALLVIVNLFLY